MLVIFTSALAVVAATLLYVGVRHLAARWGERRRKRHSRGGDRAQDIAVAIANGAAHGIDGDPGRNPHSLGPSKR